MTPRAVTLLAATVVLAVLALSGCQEEGVTVYPMLLCDKRGCDVITMNGQRVSRQWVATTPEAFSAFPATQDVIRQQSGLIESLPRDRQYKCRVRTQRDWECTRDLSTTGAFETLAMNDGALSFVQVPHSAERPLLMYVDRCQWNYIRWRNKMGYEDNKSMGRALVGWVVGCVLPNG